MRSLLSVVLMLIGTIAYADPVKDWIAQQDPSFQQVLLTSIEDETLQRYFGQCPADVFPATGQRSAGTLDCADSPGWCAMLCAGGGGDACFGLAEAIETELDTDGEATLKFPFFMAGCADGNANACTNAGASAKNGSWIAGTRPDLAASRGCQFRTYDAACTAGASWGCFMLGVEWSIEGVDGVTDQVKARAAWERACTVLPNGGACDAAKERLSGE